MTKRVMTVQEWRATQGTPIPRYDVSEEGIITIHLTPMGKPRQTQRDKWDRRACVVRYRDLADRLRAVAKLTGYKLERELYADFYLPMAKSWPKKKKAEKLGTEHDQKPDIDNMCKAVMDALSKEDKAVYRAWGDKYWSESGKPGKIVLFPSKAIFLAHRKM